MKRVKMSKKGFEISSLLGWIIGILAVFIILFIVLGPEQLLATARDAAFSFGIGLPGEKPPEIPAGEDKIPEELIRYFEYLSTKIDEEIKKSDKKRCLIPLDAIPQPRDNYFISFTPGYVSIKKKIKDKTYAATDKSQSITGFKPCIVANQGAVNFFNNWLDGSIAENPDTTNPADKEYHTDDNINSLILLQEENKLRTPNEGSGEGREYEISNADGKRYLYKADNNHFCFISVIGGSCGLKDSNKAIGKDCFDKITDAIQICGGKEIPPFMKDLIDKGYDNEFRDTIMEFNDAITQAVTSDKDICRVEFSRYPGFGDKGIVNMAKDGNNLRVEVIPNKALVQPEDIILLQKIENYQPCIVQGQNFWEWLWNGDATTKVNQHLDMTYVRITGEGANGVEFFPADAEGKTKRDLAGWRPLIYKTTDALGNKHICIMHAFADWGNSCNKDTSSRNAVDDDCIYIRDGNDRLELSRTPVC